MTAETVTVSAKSDLKNVTIPKIALDLDLDQANLVLIADNKRMTVEGDGLLGGVKTNILWRENFADQSKFRRKYNLKASVNDRAWREQLKLDFAPFMAQFMTGNMEVDLTATFKSDNAGDLKAKLNLKDMAMALPKLGWLKSPKNPAQAVIDAKFNKAGIISISSVTLNGGGLDMLANISFGRSGKLTKVYIDRLQFGQTDIRAVVAPDNAQKNAGKGSGWDIDVSGKKLDLRTWIAAEEESSFAEKSEPLTLSLNVDQVQIYTGKFLEHVNGALAFDGRVWHEAQLVSGLGDNNNLIIKLSSQGDKRELRVTSNDAGAALQTFDYYENLRGGQLTLVGKYDNMQPDSGFSGTATIETFRVIKAPLLAKLLSVASITGILENLGELGLSFGKLEAPFESQNNVITIKDASVSGLSLGLTASGTLNTAVETIDIKGTIVPAYAINNVLNNVLTNIPIIRYLFSEEGGVFAATYTMTGNVKKPDISTNPLSILAPGILRKLFGIFEGAPKKASSDK
jgi:hypothetical protein